MKVLLTGAFGNIGRSTLDELLRCGHQVCCFDIRSRANLKAALRYRGRIGVIWGDLRRPEDLAAAVRDQDVVIHLAFIIPSLSATGVDLKFHPDWARAVNVGGTRNLLDAMKAAPVPPRILFASSCAVYGRTQHQRPPRAVYDPLRPTEEYARHKVECERMIRASGLEWAILRLAATLPIALKLDPGMFDVPLDNRIEYVHTRDVGLAFARAVSCREVWGKTLLIGGGRRCQHYYWEIVEQILGRMGLGALPDEAFGVAPFVTDWLDTRESQALLRYQQRTIDDYVQDLVGQLGFRRPFIRAFRPLARALLLRQSPYLRADRPDWTQVLIYKWRAFKNPPKMQPR